MDNNWRLCVGAPFGLGRLVFTQAEASGRLIAGVHCPRRAEKLQPQPEDGRVLSEISQIFRRYVGAVFGFPAGEMTTAEFSAALAADPKAGPPVAEVLTNFLSACDKAKFTARNVAPPLNAAGRALQLIEQIESRWSEVPDSKSIPR